MRGTELMIQLLSFIVPFLWALASAFYLSYDVWIWATGFVFVASLVVSAWIARKAKAQRQPNLYGRSEFAGPRAMAEGGITTKKRQ